MRQLLFSQITNYYGIMKSLFRCNGQPLSLVVLAGGSSRRMQWDKALLPLRQGTIVEHILDQLEDHFDEVLISVSNREKFTFLNRTLIVDETPGQGPMMGIKMSLQAMTNDKCFIIACDIPDIDLGFLKKIIMKAEDIDITLPISPTGRKEPLFAVYAKSILPEIEKLLNDGILSLLPLLEHCKVRFVPIGENTWFKNLNTRKDYEDFLEQKSRHKLNG